MSHLVFALLVVVGGCGDDDAAIGDASVGDASTPPLDAGHDASAPSDASHMMDVDAGADAARLMDAGTPGPNGSDCMFPHECTSGRCVEELCVSPEGTHPDIVRVVEVRGRVPGSNWQDSYSVGDRCYCDSTFDHGIGVLLVDTPFGSRTVREVCDALGPGPGSEGRPLYNDIQCGNGPPNDAGDEDDCPGRVDIGEEGCGHIGPRWHLHTLSDI